MMAVISLNVALAIGLMLVIAIVVIAKEIK